MCNQVSIIKKQVLLPVLVQSGQVGGRTEGSPLCLYCGAISHYAAVCPRQQGPSQVGQQQGAGRTPIMGDGAAGSGWRQSDPGLACYRCGGPYILRFCPMEVAQALGNASGRSVLDGSRPAVQQDRQ
jgi:hypothetical protein